MMRTGFGQSLGAIVQFAYTVPDMDRAILDYCERLHVGPWFVRGPFTPTGASYRGNPTDVELTLARAFSGHVMIELVEQHNDAPSVYQETIKARGHGFHHWAVLTDRLDEMVGEYRALGHEIAFADTVPTGSRIVYVDTSAAMPGMIELIEHTDAQDALYTAMHAAAVDWDGRQPIRRAER